MDDSQLFRNDFQRAFEHYYFIDDCGEEYTIDGRYYADVEDELDLISVVREPNTSTKEDKLDLIQNQLSKIISILKDE